jgi:hypothetical protein
MSKKLIALFTVALTFICFAAPVQANTMTDFYGSWDFRFFYNLSSRMTNDLGSRSWDEALNDTGAQFDDGMVTVSMVDTSLLENTSSNEAGGTVPTTNGVAPIAEIDTPPPTTVPEPSTSLLFATGIASLAFAWVGRKDP